LAGGGVGGALPLIVGVPEAVAGLPATGVVGLAPAGALDLAAEAGIAGLAFAAGVFAAGAFAAAGFVAVAFGAGGFGAGVFFAAGAGVFAGGFLVWSVGACVCAHNVPQPRAIMSKLLISFIFIPY
jgi:hypothetical protein